MNTRTSDQARSLGRKLILIGGLAFLLWIPAMLVYLLVYERSTRADEVEAEIYERAGGKQILSGPILLVPGAIDTGEIDITGAPIINNVTVAYTPTVLNIDAAVKTAERRRSIYKATIYDADIVMSGRFAPLSPPRTNEGELKVFWEKAILAIKFNSPGSLKGMRDAPRLSLNGNLVETAFEPGVRGLTISQDGRMDYSPIASGVSTLIPLQNISEGFAFSIDLPISGGGGLYFSPIGETTHAAIQADWPSPSFQGDYLPDTRDIQKDNFSAQWRIPYLARDLPRSFLVNESLANLDRNKRFGAEFVTTGSPYQSVNRALKYALMFLGIVLLTLFLFEAATGERAHPAQYILLGSAQVIFYVLLLALAEHMTFAAAFALTAGATVILSGLYTATVFHSLLRGIIAFGAFSGSYALIYLLMKSEDYALLIGSITAFAALALTMFVTRNLDWYGVRITSSEARST